jgi:hypothetical protein
MMQPSMTKESQALLSYLAAQRNHVPGILESLSEEDLRRPILPSHWTCAGLVHHLAIDVTIVRSHSEAHKVVVRHSCCQRPAVP